MAIVLNLKATNDENITADDVIEFFHENLGNIWVMDYGTLSKIKHLTDGNGFNLVTLGSPPDYGWLLMGRKIVTVKEKCFLLGVL